MADSFVAPGPGEWALDRSHYPHGVTPISQWLLTEGFTGFKSLFEEIGLPASGMGVRFVNGFMYTRLQPLIGPNSAPRKPPPTLILKLATRLHPEFRKRNKAAIAAIRDRPSNAVVERWNQEFRPRLIAANRRFQSFEVDQVDNAKLQRHIGELLDELRDNYVLHFWLHGHDLGPIARFLSDCLGWGIDPGEAIAALAGASPSTARPLEILCQLRAVLDETTSQPTTLDEFRRSSDRAGALVGTYLEDHGHVLATGYDLDARTLGEMPAAIMNSIRSAQPPPDHDSTEVASVLRAQVSSADGEQFDRSLSDARAVMDMRDDNGPLAIEWPMGLLRRALLAAGGRLVEGDKLTAPELCFELTPDEARTVFANTLPSAEELERRRANRLAQAELDPPLTLGPVEPEPPLDALPPALGELIGMTQVALSHMGMDGQRSGNPMEGVGVGDQRYRGIARVASSADQAIDKLEPGDILVVRATSPAFNAVLAIAGAVVTSDGGAMSHAAVLSRELGIPAVIGASGALDIDDGAEIEVDAAAGVVRTVLSARCN